MLSAGAVSGATQGRASEPDDDRLRAGAASATERRTAVGTPGATRQAASWVLSGPSASRDKIPICDQAGCDHKPPGCAHETDGATTDDTLGPTSR